MSNTIHCQMEFQCPRGVGFCCFGCSCFSECTASICENNPDICGISTREAATNASDFSGPRMFAVRTRAGISLDRLAAILGTTTAYIKGWEQSQYKPRQRTQEKISYALGCKLSDLRE